MSKLRKPLLAAALALSATLPANIAAHAATPPDAGVARPAAQSRSQSRSQSAAQSSAPETIRHPYWSGFAARGYADVRHPGGSYWYGYVEADWRVPGNPSCTSGAHEPYVATWVGLGGFGPAKDAQLPQIGTETTCQDGHTLNWGVWEIAGQMQAAAKIPVADLLILPGNHMHAQVELYNKGRCKVARFHFVLQNVTTKQVWGATRCLNQSTERFATNAADWIVEAPVVVDRGKQTIMELFHFGKVKMWRASTIAGPSPTTPAADPKLNRIVLNIHPKKAGGIVTFKGTDFVDYNTHDAVPLALTGGRFDVEWRQ